MESKLLMTFVLLFSLATASAQETAPAPAESAPAPTTAEATPNVKEAPAEMKKEEPARAPASAGPDAFVLILKGEAVLAKDKAEEPLKKDSPLKEGDIVRTKDKSFLRIKMKDETLLSLGPNSELEIKKMKITPREVSLFHIKGQIRAKINQKSKDGETWKLNSKIVSVGVRGTEFLSNAYLVGGNSVSDVALVEGAVNSAVSIPGQATQNLAMQPGNYFNTSKVALDGAGAMENLSPEALDSLAKSGDSFIPNIQNADGSFIKLDDVLRSNFGLPALSAAAGAAVGAAVGAAAALLPSGSDDKEEKKEPVPVIKEEKAKTRVVVKGDAHKKLKDQPWDIRDAMLKRDEMRTENECFYWFYKKIPGGGDLERFRRERDCHEFDY